MRHPHAAVGVAAVAVLLMRDLPALVVERLEGFAFRDDDFGADLRCDEKERRDGQCAFHVGTRPLEGGLV